MVEGSRLYSRRQSWQSRFRAPLAFRQWLSVRRKSRCRSLDQDKFRNICCLVLSGVPTQLSLRSVLGLREEIRRRLHWQAGSVLRLAFLCPFGLLFAYPLFIVLSGS